MHSRDVVVRKLRIRTGAGASAGDSGALGRRVAALLQGAELQPVELAPSALLLVRELAAPALSPPLAAVWGGGERILWEEGVRRRLAAALREATRPRRGDLPSDARAVLFRDPGEMAAVLVWEVAQGTAESHWWWRSVRHDPAALRILPRALLGEPRHLPAAIDYLVAWGRAEAVLRRLSPREALGVFRAICGAFRLEELLRVLDSLERDARSAGPGGGDAAPWSDPLGSGARAGGPGGARERRAAGGDASGARGWERAGRATGAAGVPGGDRWRDGLRGTGTGAGGAGTPGARTGAGAGETARREAVRRLLAAPPWAGSAPRSEAWLERLGKERAALLGLASALARRPRVPRSERFASEFRAWWRAAELAERAGAAEPGSGPARGGRDALAPRRPVWLSGPGEPRHEPGAGVQAQAGGPRGDIGVPPPVAAAGAGDRRGDEAGLRPAGKPETRPARGGAESGGSGPLARANRGGREETAAGGYVERGRTGGDEGSAALAPVEGESGGSRPMEAPFVEAAGTGGWAEPDGAPSPAAARRSDALSEAASAWETEQGAEPWASATQGCVTELGGVLYLLNVMKRLRLPAAFEATWRLESSLGAWGCLQALALGLLQDWAGAGDDGGRVAPLAHDSIWRVLAELEGRPPDEPLGVGVVDPGAFAPPPEWRTWLGSGEGGGGEGKSGEAGPAEGAGGDAAIAGMAVPAPVRISAALGRWIGCVTPYVVAYMRKASTGPFAGAPAHPAALLLVRARLFVTKTHVDMVAPLDEISLPARWAGLDADPGWRPECGRVVLFHYR